MNDKMAYSPQTFADAIGVTRQHVHNMIKRGELRAVKLGRSTRIPADEVERVLGTTSIASAPSPGGPAVAHPRDVVRALAALAVVAEVFGSLTTEDLAAVQTVLRAASGAVQRQAPVEGTPS